MVTLSGGLVSIRVRGSFTSDARFVSGGNQNAETDNTASLFNELLAVCCLLLATVPGHDRHPPQVYGPMGVGVCLLGRLGTVAASHT